MEISVSSKIRQDNRIGIDIHITDMCAEKLPSFHTDEIREMVRPQIESLLRNHDVSDKEAKIMSRLVTYGKERCREFFPELFDTEKDQHPSQEC